MSATRFSTVISSPRSIPVPDMVRIPTGSVEVTVRKPFVAAELSPVENVYRERGRRRVELTCRNGDWKAFDDGPTTDAVPPQREPGDGFIVAYQNDRDEVSASRRLGRLDHVAVETLDDKNRLTYTSRRVSSRRWNLVVPEGTRVLEVRTADNQVVQRIPVASRPVAVAATAPAPAHRFPAQTILGDGNVDGLRMDLVLVSDGYSKKDLPLFEQRCKEFVDLLKVQPWFGAHMSVLRIVRIDVPVEEETFNGALQRGARQVTYDSSKLALFIDEQLTSTHWDMAILLIKGPQFGASSTPSDHSVAVMAPEEKHSEPGNPDWFEYVFHEMGHTAFGLADEYESFNPVEQRPGAAGTFFTSLSSDLESPNVTDNPARSQLKWGALAQLSEDEPLMFKKSSCGDCPPMQPVVLPVGMYEGAFFCQTGVFRPALTCRMRELHQPFCRVCIQAIHEKLRGFHPAPLLAAEQSAMAFGNLVINSEWTTSLAIANIGTGPVQNLHCEIVALGAQGASAPPFQCDLTSSSVNVQQGEWRVVRVTAGPASAPGQHKAQLRILSGNAPPLEIPLCVCVLNFTNP